MLLRGGIEECDFKNHYMLFKFSYRDDCAGNPGVAFNVDSVTWEPLHQLNSKPNSVVTRCFVDGIPAKEAKAERHRKADPNHFLGIFSTLYSTAGYFIWEEHPISRLAPFFEEGLKEYAKDWLTELTWMTARGFSLKAGEDRIAKWGHIKKGDKRWRWVAFTPEELEAIGMPANMNKMGVLW